MSSQSKIKRYNYFLGFGNYASFDAAQNSILLYYSAFNQSPSILAFSPNFMSLADLISIFSTSSSTVGLSLKCQGEQSSSEVQPYDTPYPEILIPGWWGAISEYSLSALVNLNWHLAFLLIRMLCSNLSNALLKSRPLRKLADLKKTVLGAIYSEFLLENSWWLLV